MAQIEAYINSLKVDGKSESTQEYSKYILININKFKSLERKWTKDDVDKYILNLQKTNKTSTVELKKTVIKKYFQWRGQPEIVNHLRIKRIMRSLRREDILDANDVTALIQASESPMYKALIAFLFESGARINEALNIKLSDIQETDQGMIISIPTTKTGDTYRRSIYPISSGYIRNHIDYSNPTANDKIFKISSNHVNRQLHIIAKRAGITKTVTCHRFRHAQATDMVVRGYQEAIIRKKLGWTASSRMLETYTHLVDDDVIDATLEKSGHEIKHKPIANVKTAEPMNIVDIGGIVSRLVEKNAALEEQIEALRAIIDQREEDRKDRTVEEEYEKIRKK